MTPKPESQERQASARADRNLDTANRCLVRQLRVLSRIGRHPEQVKLAEAVFKTMLQTQETMVQTHQLLTHTNEDRELRASSGAESHLSKRVGPPQLDNDGRPKSHWNSGHEATWLLSAKKLHARSGSCHEFCNEEVNSLCRNHSKFRLSNALAHSSQTSRIGVNHHLAEVNGVAVSPTSASAVKRCGLGALIAAAHQLTMTWTPLISLGTKRCVHDMAPPPSFTSMT